jgi:hypothetical protein
VDLVLSGHSHSYERSYLLDHHHGPSFTLTPTMIKDSGSGRPGETGAYQKRPIAAEPNQGAVYVVAGSAGQTSGGFLNHPAMFVSLNRLGSVVIDIDGNRLDAKFLRETGAVDDQFTILKGAPAEPLRLVTIRVGNGVVTANWRSTSGHVYRVEKCDSLPSPNWRPASDPIVATGATTSWTGAADAEAVAAFFRVVRTSP